MDSRPEGVAATFRWPRALRALRHRSFRLFWFGQVVSLTGNWMQIVAHGWLVYRLTTSPFMLGLVSVVGLIPVVPISLLAGVISDRLPRRALIVATEGVLMLQALMLAFLVWQNLIQVWHVIALSFVLGAAGSLEQPARLAFVADVAGQEDLTNAVALNASITNLARILGPVIAGLMVAQVGEAGCFLLNGLSYIPVIAALLAIRLSPAVMSLQRRTPDSGLRASLLAGWAYIRGTQATGGLMIIVAVTSFLALPYITLLPVFAADVLAVGAQGLGWLTTTVGIGAIVGAMLVAGARPGHRGWWLVLGTVLGSACLIGFCLSRSLGGSLALLFLVGGSQSVRNTLANSLIQLHTGAEYQGRVMSMYNLLFNGMSRAGALGIGGLAQMIGVPWAVGIGAAVSLVWGLLIPRLLPSVVRLA